MNIERKMIIMLMPRRRNEFDILDDIFADTFFTHQNSTLMKTDIKEKNDKYLIDVDLPGYQKENIKIELDDGYLTIHAKTDTINEDSDDEKFVRKERYVGECSRSFYVGDQILEEDIKASFNNGTLQLEIPKKEEKKEIPEKKYIQID
ncbi:MAG: Hsp20/alpha crystallin family protein [Clostridium sp.]|nr:Hsp20/alpha crystallin family protein [Clostridium sp.]MCM1443705.1 Hsp20/alpha crystallin family protein [Candidatus Amulumruptor caecigallinarius]